MNRVTVPNIKQRCDAIRKEISGVKSQYGVTQWELSFMKSIENHTWGTDKQQAMLARIEKKVFGHSKYEEVMQAKARGEVQCVVLAQ
jgi:hypothetical protein